MAKKSFDPSRATEDFDSLDIIDPAPNPNAPAKVQQQAQQRVYAGQKKVESDLYKLEVAMMQKNNGISSDNPIMGYYEHTHNFRTFDSSGKKQDRCAPVGGHYHEIKIIPGASPSDAATIIVGPPRKEVLKKVRGKRVKTSVPVTFGEGYSEEDKIIDAHTHTVTYILTQTIPLRQASMEFAKFESGYRATRETSVEGVSGT